jgi:hypothetical protein
MIANTAALARVLLILDATDRLTSSRVSDLDLARLAYFVDAFSSLWGLRAIDRFRLKSEEPRTILLRRALDRLVVSGLIVPTDVRVEDGTVAHVSARYTVDRVRAAPVLSAIRRTHVGVLEAELVDEVVYAAAGLLHGDLDEAIRLDAGQSDRRLGPGDVVDLESTAAGTSVTARAFLAGVTSTAKAEAELTHLYLAHLERSIHRG